MGGSSKMADTTVDPAVGNVPAASLSWDRAEHLDQQRERTQGGHFRPG